MGCKEHGGSSINRTLLMRSILIMIIMIAALSIQAQKKIKVDKFSKDTVSTMAAVLVKHEVFWSMSLKPYEINQADYLKLQWTSVNIMSIYKNHAMSFLMEDGSVVELYPTKSKVSDYVTSEPTTWSMSLMYYMPKDKKEALMASLVTHVRVMTVDGYTEKKMKKKRAKKLLAKLKLM